MQVAIYRQIFHSLERSHTDLISSIGDSNVQICDARGKLVKIETRPMIIHIGKFNHHQCLSKVKYPLLDGERTWWDLEWGIATNCSIIKPLCIATYRDISSVNC